MAYSNKTTGPRRRDVNYLNKDFSAFRSQLINFSQTYFPNTYTDFSNTSPGMMFIEQASYVGDVLSFYLDNQIQETFLQFARQNSNLYELAYMFGYKPKVTSLSNTTIDYFQLVPSKISGSTYVPDFDFALFVPAGSTVQSAQAETFSIGDAIDFTVSNSMDPTDISVAQTSNGNPNYYLLKKSRTATSGEITTTVVSMGAYQEFPTIELEGNNIARVLDITDGNGNVYSEVDYLAQELVYKSVKNTNVNDPNNYTDSNDAPYILRTEATQYRFTTRFKNETTLVIQFGSGNPADTDELVIPNPQNVGLGLPYEQSKLTTAFSPTNFIFTNTYGIAPSNTTLTIRYVTGGGVASNVAANTLNRPNTGNITFLKNNLSSVQADYIFKTIATNNPNAADGGMDGDTIEEIRQNTLANVGSQLRNVTADDYLVRALSMPSNLGIISKAYIAKPEVAGSTSTLDLYVLSFNRQKLLNLASNTLKNNLKTYLNQYRMIGDSITIKDAYIINIGVNFEIITLPNYNNTQVLENCILALKDFFDIDNWQINQPILLKNIQILLDEIEGVQTVQNLKITNINSRSGGYSNYAYDIDGATQNQVIYPSIDPMIFEVRYPNIDIKGQVVKF
tara:strand:- start:1166 stop:3028 length:1863 start_codon:yes stop_codon:yes gene_type:complete